MVNPRFSFFAAESEPGTLHLVPNIKELFILGKIGIWSGALPRVNLRPKLWRFQPEFPLTQRYLFSLKKITLEQTCLGKRHTMWRVWGVHSCSGLSRSWSQTCTCNNYCKTVGSMMRRHVNSWKYCFRRNICMNLFQTVKNIMIRCLL